MSAQMAQTCAWFHLVTAGVAQGNRTRRHQGSPFQEVPIKLSSIQAFVAVVERGGIHAAARTLGISHPALSKSVRQLEEELASPLLIRSSRGVATTPAGAAFYQRARLVMQELQRAAEDVSQLRNEMQGSLAVGVAPAASYDLVPIALSTFRQVHPQVRVTLSEGLPHDALKHLREGSLDLSITPITEDMSRTEFTMERLLSVEMVLLARKGHPLAGARSLASLVDAEWVRLGSGSSPEVLLNRLFLQRGLPVPLRCIDCHSPMIAMMLLRHGGYVGLMPRKVLHLPGLSADLVEVRVDEPLLRNHLALLYAASRPLTPAARAFASHVREAAGALARDPVSQSWQEMV